MSDIYLSNIIRNVNVPAGVPITPNQPFVNAMAKQALNVANKGFDFSDSGITDINDTYLANLRGRLKSPSGACADRCKLPKIRSASLQLESVRRQAGGMRYFKSDFLDALLLPSTSPVQGRRTYRVTTSQIPPESIASWGTSTAAAC